MVTGLIDRIRGVPLIREPELNRRRRRAAAAPPPPWSGFDKARRDNPPAAAPPYNWATQYAWPVDGYGPA